MSRKAKIPITLPKGSEAKVDNRLVTIKGPRGTLTQQLGPQVKVKVEPESLTVVLDPAYKEASNFHGLYWALLANMVKGVNDGFVKQLEMIGVGYRAQVSGDKLDLLIGVSHPVKMPIPDGIKVSVEKNTMIRVTGNNKQQVGQFAADIRAKRPPEPYKGKGIRYVDEYVRRKAGKTAKK